MSAVSMPDYKSSCRLCLSNRGNLPIFESYNDELGPLSSRILACLSVEIHRTDTLPKQICQRCLSLMNVWYYFKLECDSAQQKLKKWCSLITHPPNQEDQPEDIEEYNLILREVVNVKLEPEDECIAAGNSMIVDDCLQQTHPTDLGGSPDISGAVCSEGSVYQAEQVSDMGVDGDEHQRHSDSMNLVISETSSVVLNCSTEEPDPIHSLANGMENESLIRNAIENNDVDGSLHNLLDEDSSEINITYVSSGNINRSVVEVTLEDSSDETTSLLPATTVNVGQGTAQESSSNTASKDPLEESMSNWKATLMSLKKEACDASEDVDTQIKKEVENSGEEIYASSTNATKSSSTRNRFRCRFCMLPFRTSEQKDAHEKRRHKKSMYALQNISKKAKGVSSGNSNMNPQVYNYQAISLPKISNELFDEATSYCKSCKRSFTKGSFWRHIKSVHIKEDPFQCEVCKKIFPGRRELVTHRVRTVSKYCREGYVPEVDISNIITLHKETHSQRVQYQCNLCSESFSQPSSAESHARIHTGEKPFFCYKCNEREFLSRKSALNHVANCKGSVVQDVSLVPKGKVRNLSHRLTSAPIKTDSSKPISSSNEGYHCTQCNKTFNSGIGLANHLRVCKGPRKCLTCFKCIPRSSFVKHSRLCVAKSVSSSTAKCEASDTTTSASQENVSGSPISSAPRKNAPVTKIVNMSVSELQALHRDKDGKLSNFVCKLCDRTMGSRKSLQAHLLKHSAKAFRCELCNIRMCLRSTYETHMAQFHEGYFPEAISGGSSTSTEKSKTSTKLLGFKNLKLKCEVCHKIFGSLASLNYHKQSHKKVKCKLCEITFPATMEKSHICTPKAKMELGLMSEDQNNYNTRDKVEVKAPQFSCHLCKKRFHTRKMLYQHKKMHIKMKIYKCKICGNSYSEAGALQQHKQEQHAEELLQEAIESQLDAREQPNTSLDTSVHQNHPHECSICLKRYSGKDSLSRHMKLHRGSGMPMFVGGEAIPVEKEKCPGIIFCSLCDRPFDSKVSFLGHKGWHSRHIMGKSFSQIEVDSSVKDAKNTSSNSDNNLTTSSEISQTNCVAVQDKHFKCHLCNKKFSSQKNLNCHLTYHKKGFLKNTKKKLSKEKIAPTATLQNILPLPKNIHRCKICSKSFLEYSSLLQHVKSHSKNSEISKSGEGDKNITILPQEPMTCKLCNKEYRCRKSLKFHMMCHSGEKPFKCRSCSNRYSNAKALTRHERERHSQVLRPFSCNRCTTSFMAKEDLLAHYEKCTH